MSQTLFSLALRAGLALCFSCAAAPPAPAQDQPNPAPAGATQTTDAKAEEVLRRAIEAMGGRAYLAVRTVVSRGNYTPYQDGVAALPIRFADYLAFPDRERTEFSGAGVRSVQANVGEGGWLHDLKMKKVTDVTPEGAGEFRLAMRTSLDSALRGWWRAEGATLEYAGRREAGLGRRNEAVRVTYPDGFAVEFEFGAHDGLPAKAKYKKVNKEGEAVEEEDRYAQFLTIGAVRAPFVVDHYRAGVQSSRVNFEEVKFNAPVPDSLFARPSDAKPNK